VDGVTICRAIRGQGANTATPILMLTARQAESDKVVGLESGADDCPFPSASISSGATSAKTRAARR